MVIITLQRNKCIGCNYCAEMAPSHFKMFKKDGKSVLLYAKEKKGFDMFLGLFLIYQKWQLRSN